MRYYGFILGCNAESIEENARIHLRDYCYDKGIGAMNNYMYKTLGNGITFFGYREEGNTLPCVFSYEDKAMSFADAYGQITELLRDALGISVIKEDPSEITMLQFLDCLQEFKRRDYGNYFHRIVEGSDLWIYPYFYGTEKGDALPYDFRERIIEDKTGEDPEIYDGSLLRELSSIRAHRNDSGHAGNPVHYIISGRSMEAAEDMTEALMRALYKANRIGTRRMEIISALSPHVYGTNSHLETIIENNYGGTIVIDLTERFGFDPVDYDRTVKYLLNLVRKYRNQCLFVFTYNMDDPGFSYQILPELNRYVYPVALREGTTDRRGAAAYLKSLVVRSEYAEYAEHTDEYLHTIPGERFTQTDVLGFHDRFGAWCLSRYVLGTCGCDQDGSFALERDEDTESSLEKLRKLTGLGAVKEKIERVLAADLVERERRKRTGESSGQGTMHMIFSGNPGCAKTTVARLFAGIAKEKGLLASGAFVERGGMDLDGLCCVTNIRRAFKAARGGVLFIDEAYSLQSSTAITVLIREMEDRKDDVIVILAGYADRMEDFLKRNEGLESRIPHRVEFPDYSMEELTDIFRGMLAERGFRATGGAVREAEYLFEKARHVDHFGNGRYVRNIMEQAIRSQAVRLMTGRENTEEIGTRSLFLITKEDIGSGDAGKGKERLKGSAEARLREMTGLASAKEVIFKALSGFKLKRLCMDRGMEVNAFSLHMVFTGNPGTAKTTVARLFAEILKDEKVLPTGKFVEVSRADLVGDHVGATAILVKKRFAEAKGGVLFIDEAYSLCDSYENGFGDEAITTIVQEMENMRDEVIVIFAGYPEPMERFLERNPGMASRIAFHVEFDDYTPEEMIAITKKMLKQNGMRITDGALRKLRGYYEHACGGKDSGNGRFVRKMLEEARMNLAERILKSGREHITDALLTTIREEDIPEYLPNKENAAQRIGFA